MFLLVILLYQFLLLLAIRLPQIAFRSEARVVARVRESPLWGLQSLPLLLWVGAEVVLLGWARLLEEVEVWAALLPLGRA